MEIVLFLLFVASVIFLLVALFFLPYINGLIKQIRTSYDLIPTPTNLSEVVPEINYVFPDTVPLVTKTIRLGPRSRRITLSVPNCPECGRYLIMREGRYGKFWGCTGYPNCHFTKKYK